MKRTGIPQGRVVAGEHDKEEIIRIVSAREANKRERGIYFQQASE